MKTIKICAYVLMASGMLLTSCGSDDSSDLPDIGGYGSADEVAAADLIGYWPLDGDGEETISGTMPSNEVNESWVEGIKGEAVHLNEGFLDYPSIAALNLQSETGSITVSCWAKITNTKLVADGPSHISPLVSFSGGPNENVGNLAIFGNTHGLTSSDSIQMKAEYHFKNPDGVDFNGDAINMTKMEQWMIDGNAGGQNPPHAAFANKIGGQWAHVVFVWNGANANAQIWVNGQKISNPAWESRNNGDPMPMAFFTPTRPIIGALNTVANGTNVEVWNAALTGEVDEIRVFKKALIQGDINSLYLLEKDGR